MSGKVAVALSPQKVQFFLRSTTFIVQKEKKMKVTLTVKTKDEIKNGKRVIEYADKEFELDLSLNCQMRWEKHFPAQAEKEDILLYTERIRDLLKRDSLSAPLIISMFKAIYCYFDTDMKFQEFLAMFDFSNATYVEKLVGQLKEVFEIVEAEAVEKN